MKLVQSFAYLIKNVRQHVLYKVLIAIEMQVTLHKTDNNACSMLSYMNSV